MKAKKIGSAKRIRVELACGEVRGAWDCRRFGFGRIVAPTLPVQIDLDHGTQLDLRTGELQGVGSSIAA